MHLIVNALSVNNVSGRHVLMGHLRQLARHLQFSHQFTILYHHANGDLVENLGEHVAWHRCPEATTRWLPRSLWERRKLPGLIQKLGGDGLFSPAGISYSGVTVPQMIFCQNPSCLVPDIHQGIFEKTKAALQRLAYRKAVQQADWLVYNSEFMRTLYEQNAGRSALRSVVVYQGVNEACFEKAAELQSICERSKNQILTVSVMGPHKGMEIICDALAILKDRKVDFSWKIIGEWVHEGYRKEILSKIQTLNLQDRVHLEGHVPREVLDRAYAESRVFCLMSKCESFGIPAVEAQSFGTPVVTSQGCAMPEVDGEGGLYPPRGDAEATADALETLLTNSVVWTDLSSKAHLNSERFRWETCSLPLVEAVSILQEK
jgi:glycosyltransferase involved in cell wall biosynthesis